MIAKQVVIYELTCLVSPELVTVDPYHALRNNLPFFVFFCPFGEALTYYLLYKRRTSIFWDSEKNSRIDPRRPGMDKVSHILCQLE